MLRNKSAVSFLRAALLLAGAVLVSSPVPALACEGGDCTPTMADVTAINLQALMAKAKNKLAEEQAKANGGSTKDTASYRSETRIPVADPTVVMVMGSSNGLVATLAFPTGGIQKKHAGDSIGHGVRIESISVTDVVVRDGNGRRSLTWSDGSSNGGAALQTGAMPSPGAGFMVPPEAPIGSAN